MNSTGILLTVVFSVLSLIGSRFVAMLAVIGATCYVTQGQQFTFASFHFTSVRAVLLVATLRCLFRGEIRRLEINRIDKMLIAFALTQMFIYTLRERTSDAFVYKLGCTYDILLAYFVVRGLVTKVDEVWSYLRGLAWLILPFTAFMIMESVTGHNLFSVMGGQGWGETYYREGRARCVGSFRGPHSAGIFGATMFPLFVALWQSKSGRFGAVLGAVASLIIVYTSNSSGPLTAFVGGLVGLLFWVFHRNMQLVRRGIVIALCILHLMMNAPVWFIFAKISNVLGGDGYTRSFVIDQAIHRFSEWWLLGTSSTASWMGFDDWTSNIDMTDQFVGYGVNGGLLGMVLYVVIFVYCFSDLGRAARRVRDQSIEIEWLLWCFGASLFAHVMAQFSVGYFDQIYVAWWGLVAVISSLSYGVLKQAGVSAASDWSEQVTVTEIIAQPIPREQF